MITVIGSINLDLIATVERLPEPGETVPGDSFVTSPGGKGANQALAACRAGAVTRMIGAVGRDGFAGEAVALLKESGINLSGVVPTDLATGVALIQVERRGENMIAVIPGANGAVTAKQVENAGLAAGEIVLLQHEIPLATVEAALQAARAAGALSVLNTAPFHADATAFLTLADYVVANETEFDLYADALQLAGTDREARMRAFAGHTGRTVIVTLGADGVWAATPERFSRYPAHPVEPIDTVGAGDTFCGYLAAGLEAGRDLDSSIRRAAVAGALACLKPGAQPSIPLAGEVDAAIAG